MRTSLGPSITGLFLVGIFSNLLLIAALMFPMKWTWNAWIASWLELPAMQIEHAFGVLLLLMILSTVARGVKLSAHAMV